jgi:hypothetical protein
LAEEIREVFPAMALMENIAVISEPAEECPQTPAAPEAVPLQQLGDYRFIRTIGHGGMGIVYEAEQVSLGRHVALKVLPRKMLVDAKHRRRFEREARLAAKLHHTNIVPVFGVGEHEGLPYYVMQFIQGLGLPLADHRPVCAGRRGLEPEPLSNGGPGGSTGGRRRGRIPGCTFTRATGGEPVGFVGGVAGPEQDCRAAQGEAADLLAERGPDRRAGGRGTGVRPSSRGCARQAAPHVRERV